MRLVALVVVWGLIVGQDGRGAAMQGDDAMLRTPATGESDSSGSVLSALSSRSTGELPDEDPSSCFALRENEDQRQLLCNDRRSKFNFNPFGLRFGKRYNGYIYRRAVKRARTKKFTPLSLFSRDLEVPT
ncbi:kisspeptin 2 [Cheilinus undulatus]|uniref:kisspeptin 2 n=1 Tax=Cheilinus undulatus TaxID=241271 RepID=UPI001BD66DAF|nr:kisspeptin 2 [Cheilinus undulatus]